jgi:hypothetical protein
MIEYVLKSTVTYTRKQGVNYTTNTGKTILRNSYKQFMKVMLTYYGKLCEPRGLILTKQDIVKLSFKGMVMYIYVIM